MISKLILNVLDSLSTGNPCGRTLPSVALSTNVEKMGREGKTSTAL